MGRNSSRGKSGMTRRLLVEPGTKVDLSDHDTSETWGWKQGDALTEQLQKNLARIDELQYVMYAENKRALLIVLQAMDAGGKDGVIRHVITGFNAQGCRVTPFKVPTPEETSHDFLWRIHRAVPGRGNVGIFNRSHYEDLLVVRVHELVPRKVWSRRFEIINDFEAQLVDDGVTILKFFLHISKKEQKARLEARRDDPKRNWKFSPADIKERGYWKQYMRAYEEILSRCSTSRAPWYVIPSDRKWFRNLAVSKIIVETLESMKMKMPPPQPGVSNIRIV
ncbi:MAG TPA: polyphosphate kinase 2 family protein [Patescibacteria group bacterium]|nr:polyphosphate kinase 2 family protein [Patescibacteria group bacterium]